MTSPPPARYVAEVFDAATGYAAFESDWYGLALEAERANCFALPAYFRNWYETLSDDVETRLLVVRDGAQLLGVMPVMRARVWRGPSCVPRHDYAPADRLFVLHKRPRPFPVRQIAPVLSMPAQIAVPAPLCRAGTERDVTLAMARALVQMPKWDVIVIPSFEGIERDNWLSAFGLLGLDPRVHRLHRFIRSLRHVRPFSDIVAKHSKKFRQNIRRAQAAADKAGIEFTVHEGPQAVGQCLTTIEQVAKASWKYSGKPEAELLIPYQGRQQTFFERLLLDPVLGAYPVVLLATAAAERICVLLALRHAQTMTTLLTFWNNRYPQASPGILLLGRLIDWCVEHHVTYLDFNATSPSVRHLTDDIRSSDNVVVFAPTVAGRMFSWISKAAQSLH